MTNKNNATMKYITVFITMMLICFLWIGYPYAPYKDFVLENLVSPVFFVFITLSWTKFRVGKTIRDKVDYFGITFIMFFVLVCMIGQTYLNLDLATAFWSTFTIILQKFEKVLTLFLIPLVVGFFTDKFVSMLEKIEQG